MRARFKRRISSSLFPENIEPTITSIQPAPFCLFFRRSSVLSNANSSIINLRNERLASALWSDNAEGVKNDVMIRSREGGITPAHSVSILGRQLHPPFRKSQFRKTELFIQPVCVFGRKHPSPQPLQFRMLQHRSHQSFAQS